jgi:hypothetical protein
MCNARECFKKLTKALIRTLKIQMECLSMQKERGRKGNVQTKKKPRKKRTISIRLDLYQWIEKQIEEGRFWNFNHAVEVALDQLGEIQVQTT